MKKQIIIISSIFFIVVIFIVAFALQKYSSFKPFDYLTGEYKAKYYKPSQSGPQVNTYSGPSAENHLNVFIRDSEFVPNFNAVALGTEVTWHNEDEISHALSGEDWESGEIAPGEKFVKIFDTAGEYIIELSGKPSIKGEIRVQ